MTDNASTSDATPLASRRALLGGISGALTTSLAGCAGGGGGDGGSGTSSGSPSGQNVADELVTARARMGTLATDLERYVENEDVAFDDIDPHGRLDDANAALQEAADAVQTSEGERQLETLVALLDVLDGIIRGITAIIGDGLSSLGDALKAHARTENHEEEVVLNEEGDVMNPGEMADMMCGQMGELRDANHHLDEAPDAFDDGIAILKRQKSAFDEIESAVEAFEQVDAGAVRTAIDGSVTDATELKDMVRGLKQEVNGEIASHEAGLMWTWTVSPAATGAYECENGSFSVDGSEDLENDIRPRYVDSREFFEDSNGVLTAVDGETLRPELAGTRRSFVCLTDYAARATDHRIQSIDALLDGDKEAYSDHVHTAFDLEEKAARECA